MNGTMTLSPIFAAHSFEQLRKIVFKIVADYFKVSAIVVEQTGYVGFKHSKTTGATLKSQTAPRMVPADFGADGLIHYVANSLESPLLKPSKNTLKRSRDDSTETDDKTEVNWKNAADVYMYLVDTVGLSKLSQRQLYRWAELIVCFIWPAVLLILFC